ncbi:methyltransferase [Desulfotruncus alcoholivorax]|uniref:methyltransferase n=1 Tax=Desulfotruncus alcoholivorax TaxID=265477 RepID=UPI00040DB676|nr:methyltransferase [Desulfotruncus alcoholivorax]
MKYIWDEELNLFKRRAHMEAFTYSDGAEVEQRLFDIVRNASDRSTFSHELIKEITDWPLEYHLSRARHCLVRPLGIKPGEKVLELGCGCGAITRYLGEIGAEVVAVEGSIARARIAAERCRDLSNVKVFVDDLLRFETGQRFDWILLVGVLEYAPVFTDEKEPTQHYLCTVARFLAPDGKLVIAIENKLGLKYFNGCSEDHLGVPFISVQNLYGTKTPRTFGRRELLEQLSAAGFLHCYFYYPFPDYKLPSVVLSDDALKDPQFDAVDLIIRSHARDYSGSPYRLFDEALVFSTLSANGLFAEFSNSFLVIATLANNIPYRSDRLAMTFAVNRIPEFSVVTSFYRSDDVIHVVKESVFPDLPRKRQFQDCFNILNMPSESIYHPGRQMLWRLICVRANKGTLDQVVAELRPWVIYLLQFATTDGLLEPSVIGADERDSLKHWLVPGTYLDCTPFNLIESTKGLIFIDNEWQADSDVPLGWVITRGVLHSLSVGLAPGNPIKSVADVIQGLCISVGLSMTEAEVADWFNMEASFQSLVTNQELSSILISPDHSASGLICFTQALAERDGQIASLNQIIDGRDEQIANLKRVLTERDEQIAHFNQVMAECDGQIANLNQAMIERDGQIASLNQVVAEQNDLVNRILASRSWRITRPLRWIVRLLRGEFFFESLRNLINNRCLLFRRRINTLRTLLRKRDFIEIWNRVKRIYGFSMGSITSSLPIEVRKLDDGIVLLATKHTFYVALLIEQTLKRFSFDNVVILDSEPSSFEDKVHIVICPQMFTKLPLQYIAFQMEQSVSSRWFNKVYFDRLENSIAIMDYSLTNIKFLQEKKLSYRQIFWTPMSNIVDFSELLLAKQIVDLSFVTEPEYDVVFYGDVNCPRRRKFLDCIGKKFRLLILSEVFGEELYSQLKKARVVVNIHYYENALLETTRIFECLSLGLDVISEESSDMEFYQHLIDYVTFTPIGDIDSMIRAITQLLSCNKGAASRLEADISHFAFYFGRMLVALDLMPVEKIINYDLLPVKTLRREISLSLPETYMRHEHFKHIYPGIPIFHGLRHYQGWIGCALSYKYLCRQALKYNLPYLVICEDDAQMNDGFNEKWRAVKRFLFNELGIANWDVFCGLIADVADNVNVLDVVDFDGIRFVIIDRMTSMVFNIYGQKAMTAIANWDPNNRDVHSNTIDRYLEQQVRLKVVTTIPFIVGHSPDLTSTLWNFQNNIYDDMISRSQCKLAEKVDDFLKKKYYKENKVNE